MYGVDMYYTVKTLLERGKSQREISRELKIHRDTVRKIKESIESGHVEPPPITKPRKLDAYHDEIRDRIHYQSAQLVYEWLVGEKGVEVSYPTVSRYVRQFKHEEVYVPVHSDPGEEAQVDFGYLGRFVLNGKLVKVWIFCMILSHSRYGYFELVLDQSVKTFIGCHLHAFEFFGGVPETVKIDNLKAGVITPNFYEAVIQHQYAEFHSHYGSLPITARPRRGQDKGKVESGVKYVKGNFLKRSRDKDYDRLERDLKHWRDEICNRRVHGTTRRIPGDVFAQTEKAHLKPLPQQRYEHYEICQRKVDRMGHVTYQYNHYSVPSQYTGQEVDLRCNGSVLRISLNGDEIALHSIFHGTGEFITKESHKPAYKQKKSEMWYRERMTEIGPQAVAFLDALKAHRPRHWHAMAKGVIALGKLHDHTEVNLSSKRALAYGALSYLEVKSVLEKGHFEKPVEDPASGLGGHSQELGIYDQLLN